MYNLLIVDDEAEILEWLKELFLYDCDAELDVYTAGSGKQAITILNDIKVDIVLTDIKMPGMDGITLYRHIKENWPKAHIVFLTGYRDHEALYEIIKNKEVRYVLKTEGDHIIVQTILDILEEMEQSARNFMLEEERNRVLLKAKTWLQKEYMQKILTNDTREDIMQEKLNELEIPVKCEYPLLAYVGWIGGGGPILQSQIIDVIYQSMPIYVDSFCFMPEVNYLLILVQPHMADSYIDWNRVYHVSKGAMEDVQNSCMTVFKECIPFAVSGKAEFLDKLGEKYCQLKKRLLTIIQENEPSIIVLAEEEEIIFDMKLITLKMPLLSSYLEMGRKKEFFSLLEEMTQPFLALTSKHDMAALELYYNLSMIYLKIINLNRLQDRLPFHIGMYKLTRVEEHSNWKEAVDYLKELGEILFTLLGEADSARKDLTMKKIEDYIRENLGSDLTLTKLAEIGGFNASYLSRIFKQKYQCNLSEYITAQRMGEAKRLLVHTNDKINTIGDRVGYNSPHSFTRVFKASENVSPAEYRSLYR